MLDRIRAIAMKEIRQLRRDRLTFGMIVGIPPGAVDHDAGQLVRVDDRQAAALRVHRPDPDHADPGVGCGVVRRAGERGVGALYLAALLFIAATLTLGLLASTLAQTQMQAFQMSFFVLLPSILLSGFVFPFEGMPSLAQWIAQVLPLTHFIELVRGIVLRGAGLGDLLLPIYKLLGFTVLSLAVVTLRFHKSLD